MADLPDYPCTEAATGNNPSRRTAARTPQGKTRHALPKIGLREKKRDKRNYVHHRKCSAGDLLFTVWGRWCPAGEKKEAFCVLTKERAYRGRVRANPASSPSSRLPPPSRPHSREKEAKESPNGFGRKLQERHPFLPSHRVVAMVAIAKIGTIKKNKGVFFFPQGDRGEKKNSPTIL